MLRQGKSCSHTGCLHHITHPCEKCLRLAGKYTFQSAIEAHKFGFNITFDGDKNKEMFGTQCNHCGRYFEDESLEVYCEKCRKLIL